MPSQNGKQRMVLQQMGCEVRAPIVVSGQREKKTSLPMLFITSALTTATIPMPVSSSSTMDISIPLTGMLSSGTTHQHSQPTMEPSTTIPVKKTGSQLSSSTTGMSAYHQSRAQRFSTREVFQFTSVLTTTEPSTNCWTHNTALGMLAAKSGTTSPSA